MAEPPSQSGPIQSSAIQSIPRRYVKRGIEGALLEALDGGSAVALAGLSGAGKSNTACYVGIELMASGRPAVILTTTTPAGRGDRKGARGRRGRKGREGPDTGDPCA